MFGIFKNKRVEVVDKRHCSLTSVPEHLWRYSRTLEELLLDTNYIKELSKVYTRLYSYIKTSSLFQIVDVCLYIKDCFRLKRLRKLSVSQNEIDTIPDDIQNLDTLVELDVSKNGERQFLVHYAYYIGAIYKVSYISLKKYP